MIFLSVGLIVKNEEQNIGRCLDTVLNLFSRLSVLGDNYSGELVIVDTGSTDDTVKICKEYTDKVYSYKWKDDFSDARNFGLSKCSGKWFMYLDADEVLDEDVEPLVDFLVHGDEFNSARLIFKNYADEDECNYTESRNLRLIRISDNDDNKLQNVKFVGEVHEALPELNPCKQLCQVVHHYGYVVKDGEDAVLALKEKHQRNMPALLKAYKKDAKNPRTLAHLFYSCDVKDKEKYLNEWYSLLSDDSDKTGICVVTKSLYSLPVYVAIIQTLVDGGCYDDAIYYAQEYLNSYADKENVTTMSVLALTVCALSSSGQPALAADFFESYEELYRKFKVGTLSANELETCVVFFGITEADYFGLAVLSMTDLIKSGQKSRARVKLIALDRKNMPKVFEGSLKTVENSLK